MKHILAAVLGGSLLGAPALAQEGAPPEGGGTGEMGSEGMTTESTATGESMVLEPGKIGVGGAFGIGLDKDNAAKQIGLELGGDYGIVDNLQAGVMLNILLKHPVDDAALQGVTLGGQYQALPFMAPTLDIDIVRVVNATSGDSEYKVAVGISAPIKYMVSDMLAVKALHDIMLRPGGQLASLGTPLLYFGADPIKKGFAFAAGAEVNPNGPFKAGLDFAFVLPDFKSDNRALPLVLSGTYDVGAVDVGLAFGFDNLAPKTTPPNAADLRYLALFARGTL